MAKATDAFRIAKAHTPLGDKLLFREMSGREELSRPFDYRLELLAEDDSTVDPKAVLGRPITVELEIQGGGSRYIDTQCIRFAYIGVETVPGSNTKFWRYEARLRPWTHYMTLRANCRLWQETSVPDIVRAILEQYAYPVEFRLSRSYRAWEYCVQYQETDFNFMCRLLEHEGIYFFFEHSNGSHKLVFADDIGAHTTLPGYARIPHLPADKMVVPDEEYLDNLHMEQEVETGDYETNDFDFKHPYGNLTAAKVEVLPYPNGDKQVYEWPGGYVEPTWGNQYASTRLEELQRPKEIISAHSTARGLAPGYLFTVERCPRRDQNREYLLVSVDVFVRNNPYHTGTGRPAEWQFSLIAQPSSTTYRPARLTPKPRTTGPQTAVVVGLKDKDEEIVCDEYGRVRVQFHWDRYHKYDEESSCWIRVSSGWAGNNWGQISIPRVGQEVIVDFLNGDPDYPIIIGRVYNQEHKVPYALPRWKEYSTWKSRSTKYGGNNDWNEIRLYDYKGKEQVFIQAQWRMDVRVKWNKYLTVRENWHSLIGGGYYLTIGANYDLKVKGVIYENAEGEINLSSKSDIQIAAEGNVQISADGNLEGSAQSNIVLDAQGKLTLRSGGSFITIDAGGIAISGPVVRINSGGTPGDASDFDAELPYGASEADHGEPGYLDRPPKGGGWGKRGSIKGGPRRATPSSAVKKAGAASVQALIDEANALAAAGDAAGAAAKRQAAINEAIKVYGIDTSNTKGVTYDPTVSGEAVSSPDGTVRVGDAAFRNAGWLGSSLGHEAEGHVNQQAKPDRWYTGPQGTAIQEVQCYDYEIANAKRYGTSAADLADLQRRRKAHYDALTPDNKKRVDGPPPDYTLKPGEEST